MYALLHIDMITRVTTAMISSTRETMSAIRKCFVACEDPTAVDPMDSRPQEGQNRLPCGIRAEQAEQDTIRFRPIRK